MQTPADDWNADFVDLVDAFLTAKVDFLVVGALRSRSTACCGQRPTSTSS